MKKFRFKKSILFFSLPIINVFLSLFTYSTIQDIDNLKNEQINENKVDNKQIEKNINEFLALENPNRELIINLVEKIYIYQDKTIDIIFTFKNVT